MGRQAAVANATSTSDVVAQFNTWLARARTHGFDSSLIIDSLELQGILGLW